MVETVEHIALKMQSAELRRMSGRVVSVSGLLVRASVPGVRLGELCELFEPGRGIIGWADVVGIDGEVALLSLHSDLRGLSLRTEVIPTGREPDVLVGEFLLGSVVDAHGNLLKSTRQHPANDERIRQPLYGTPSNPLTRIPVHNRFALGIPAIDGFLSCGEGQRVGIFGSPGVGKSTLIGQIIDNAKADVVVCALVGERGREVGEFVDRLMPSDVPTNRILVVATSDRPALERFKAVLTATTIAEHFRDAGKRVLLVVDSVTRLARALREIGLAAGEPPVRRGFPPSVFATLPQLFERAGNSALGTMTAFYTVLVEGDEQDDPIAEETRALLDGHIVLSDRLAQSGRFPAIDVLASRSRVMNAVVDREHKRSAAHIRSLMATYRDIELLIRVGEFREGQDAVADEAVRKHQMIGELIFESTPNVPFEETVERLRTLAS